MIYLFIWISFAPSLPFFILFFFWVFFFFSSPHPSYHALRARLHGAGTSGFVAPAAVGGSGGGAAAAEAELLDYFGAVQKRHAELRIAQSAGAVDRLELGKEGEPENEELGDIPSLLSLQVHTKSKIITLP
jgi:hypothetical protein